MKNNFMKGARKLLSMFLVIVMTFSMVDVSGLETVFAAPGGGHYHPYRS